MTMKLKGLVAWTLMAGIAWGQVSGTGTSLPEGYSPPLISNGRLNMLVDWWGGQGTNAYYQLKTEVYWQGRRNVAREARLFGFGRFNPLVTVDGERIELPTAWTQSLDITTGVVRCVGDYAGVTVTTEVFCPLDLNVIAFRRTFASRDGRTHRVTADLSYALPPHDRLTGSWSQTNSLRRYTGRTYGHRVTDFTITLAGAGKVAWEVRPQKPCTADWFVVFTDSYEEAARETPAARADRLVRYLSETGFDGLRDANAIAWADYYDKAMIRVPDTSIQRMFDVQQYHLRCNAGRWGFPVGIFPHHWQGKYFGFDATYMHDGLVACGRFEVAQRCPDWRFSVMPWAQRRQGYYQKPGKYGARWMWMSLEDGDLDVAGIGFWKDHIFAMGTIARSAWTQFQYTGDRAWLSEKGYPVIRNCALFFRNNWIHEQGGGVAYIGRCTDLERLGPSRDRAFLSTCSAIYALRAAADAAAALGTNAVEAADFRAAADRLVKGLPVSPDGTRYVAYADCREESVGTLGGLYPFPVFGTNETRQVRAAYHFIEKGRAAGNMYPMGTKVCPWYAGKMAATMVKLGDRTEPARWLKEAASVQGLFGETWEINEPGLRIHPWFTTASGACSFALAQMLVAEIDGMLHLAPGVPEAWRDYAFRLPAPGGFWVECSVRAGRMAEVRFTWNRPREPGRVTYVFGGQIRTGVIQPPSPREAVVVAVDGESRDIPAGETPADTIVAVWRTLRVLRAARPDAVITVHPMPSGVSADVVNAELVKLADEKTVFAPAVEQKPATAGTLRTCRPVSCIGLTRSWDPGPEWWIRRLAERRAQIRRSGGEIDLVFVGDSITHNWEGARGPGSDKGGRPLGLLKEKYSVLNAGYGGDGTQHVLWRLENGELDGYRARGIMLMIGTNNGEKPADVAAGVRAILDLIARKQPQAVTVLLPIFPSGATPDHPWRVRKDEVNRMIRSFADGKKVQWCDFNRDFLEPDGSISPSMMPDTLHPQEAGYEIWYRRVLPYFERLPR